MMRYNSLYGGYGGSNLGWVKNASSQLQNDSWNICTPLIFDGSCWSNSIREEAAVGLFKALQQNTTAKTVIFRNSVIGPEAAAALSQTFEMNSHVKSITIKNLVTDRAEWPISLPASIFKNSSLREVTLERCFLEESACAELASLLRSRECNLRSLVFKTVAFTASGLNELSAAIAENRSLRFVTLRNMKQLSLEAIHQLLMALSENTSIQLLELEEMNLNDQHAQDIARFLVRNSSVELFSLHGNMLNCDALDMIMRKGLQGNTTLRALDISDNSIGIKGARAIVYCMKQNSTLQNLSLKNCGISRKACKVIARGIATFPGLKHLSMDMNRMELCGVELLDSLRDNKVIQSILRSQPSHMFRHHDQKKEAAIWDQIEVYLRLNKANRGALKKLQAMPSSYTARFLAKPIVSKEPDVLFHFLENMPTLCHHQQ